MTGRVAAPDRAEPEAPPSLAEERGPMLYHSERINLRTRSSSSPPRHSTAVKVDETYHAAYVV